MHIYNEAIRRTVGAYVLYPGTDEDRPENERLFRRYHEVLPGVGAFVMRPEPNGMDQSFAAAGSDTLMQFIRDVLYIQHNRFSQLYRLNYWTHDTVREASPFAEKPDLPEGTRLVSGADEAGTKPPADIAVLLGYIRPEAAEICWEKGVFYYHAIEEDDGPSPVKPDVFHADYLLPYTRNGTPLEWIAGIEETKLVKREEVLHELGIPDDGTILQSKCPYYFLVSLDTPSQLSSGLDHISACIPRRARQPFIKSWQELFGGKQSV